MIPEREIFVGCTYTYGHKIHTLTREDVNEILELYTEDILDPIFLTAEVLEHCGFIKCENVNVFEKHFSNGNKMQFDLDGKTYLSGDEVYTTKQTFQIDNLKYLHQLQNFYFTIVGEELPFNPPQEKGRIYSISDGKTI